MKKLLLVIFIISPIPVYGQYADIYSDNPVDRQFETDSDKLYSSMKWSTGTQTELYYIYADIWDAELNNVYQLLMEMIEPEYREQLRDSQRAWLEHYELEQEFQKNILSNGGELAFSWVNGSLGIMEWAGDIMNKKRERTLELIRLYNILVYEYTEYSKDNKDYRFLFGNEG